ncbi:ribosomal protein L12E/L44/L45/RPP1/RPP2 [Catenulispora sp. GAS73]|uniref:hypothetical protein n=1 Tax=Catenulispora sp. GAS73 TaxID=3156269 RepID=UPI003511FED5
MERMGPRRAGDENGVGTTAGRAGVVRATAVTAAVVAALAGCSVTVQPKNAAATRPLTSSSPTPSATASSAAPSTSAASTSAASPTPTPSDVDHTVCSNVRDVLATLKSKLATDKDSHSRSAQDYRTAGNALHVQDTKTDNSDLRATLKTVGTDYQNVGHDVANYESADADLAKAVEASKPLATLCGGGSGTSTSTSPGSTASSSN